MSNKCRDMTEIKMIGFDWDGTLVDSMIEVKSKAFAEAVIEYHPPLKGEKEGIRKIYLETRGTPREDQLRKVEKTFDVQPLTEDEVEEWSKAFTENYIDVVPPLFNDTVSTLRKLKKKGFDIYLSSSVPQKDLEATLEKYEGLDQEMFEFILGTRDEAPEGYSLEKRSLGENRFRKGPGHIRFVLNERGLSPENILFAGDGIEDVKGANNAGSTSVGIVDSRMPGKVEESMRNADADYIVQDRESILELEVL